MAIIATQQTAPATKPPTTSSTRMPQSSPPPHSFLLRSRIRLAVWVIGSEGLVWSVGVVVPRIGTRRWQPTRREFQSPPLRLPVNKLPPTETSLLRGLQNQGEVAFCIDCVVDHDPQKETTTSLVGRSTSQYVVPPGIVQVELPSPWRVPTYRFEQSQSALSR